jgi:hypothetical protein
MTQDEAIFEATATATPDEYEDGSGITVFPIDDEDEEY